uniref:PID domain-containing protein n=2 Tax=Photinus pyralis TaxID=7054 RepID=A0A1Y1LIN6_PHOPY
MLESYSQHFGPGSPGSASFDETPLDPEPDNVCKSATPSLQGVHDTSTIPLAPGTTGTVFRLQFLGSVEVDEEGGRKRRKRLKKNMVEVAVTKIKVCLFPISVYLLKFI